MKRTLTLALIGTLFCTVARSQTTDLVLFADDASKFTLLVDGEVKNDIPASRVIATGIRNETPVLVIRFEDPSIPQIRKSGFYEMGKEYTIMVTTNKKGERTLRLTGQAELGTAANAAPAPARPAEFVDDDPASSKVSTTAPLTLADETEQVTTVTTVKEGGTTGGGENMQINMAVNGVNLNMGVNIEDGMEGGSTSMTTTTTTTTTSRSGSVSGTSATKVPATPVKETEMYRMPGYSGPIGCAMPMGSSEFAEARKGVESQSFEDTRLSMAKQIGRDRCFSAEQVRSMMAAFNFEDTRLEFAKYAYDRTHDLGNYYKVNEAFQFSSSVDELNEYLGSR